MKKKWDALLIPFFPNRTYISGWKALRWLVLVASALNSMNFIGFPDLCFLIHSLMIAVDFEASLTQVLPLSLGRWHGSAFTCPMPYRIFCMSCSYSEFQPFWPDYPYLIYRMFSHFPLPILSKIRMFRMMGKEYKSADPIFSLLIPRSCISW